VNQDRCAMKISTDAVILGALAESDSCENILDIGSGTGVIALMLAQRFPFANIIGVEIDDEAASQARENFSESPFSEQLTIWEGDFLNFPVSDKFDLIVSNPPFFPNHLKSADYKRNQALHTDSLSFQDLIEKVNELLDESGAFWVILPPRQMEDLLSEATKNHLFANKKFSIQDKPSSKIYREICSISRKSGRCESVAIIIKNDRGDAHPSYSNLMIGFLRDFPAPLID